MSSPKNLHRDGTYIGPEQALVAWSNGNAVGAAGSEFSGPAAIQTDFALVQADYTVTETHNLGNGYGIGLYFENPLTDRVPYRVKASINVEGAWDYDHSAMIVVGYGIASPTGSNDAIEDPRYIPFNKNFDDLIIVEKSASHTTLPLAIGLIHAPAQTVTTKHIFGQLSVQCLGTSPPTMHNAVS